MALEDFKNNNSPSDKRKLLVRIATNVLNIYGIEYNIASGDREDFIDGKENKNFNSICLCFSLGKNVGKACKVVNREIKQYGGKFKHDEHGIGILYLKDDIGANELDLPDVQDDIHYILDNTPDDRIFLTTDWHIFGHYYGKGRNPVNIQEIVSWCKKNIKDEDVLINCGDLTHRYANKEHQEEAAKIYRSLPGIKVLILGNHDIATGEDFYTNCGFDFIFKRLVHNGIVYSHRPENIEADPELWFNIHGHKHDVQTYNVTSGENSVNVYPAFFNNKPTTLDYVLNHRDKLTKDNVQDFWSNYTESALNETKRSELPDSSFGIPEDRKFPLDTEQHVKSAIKLFGHAEESKKKQLAQRISTAAKRYNVKISDTCQINKYLTESVEHIIPKDIDTLIFDMGKVLVGDTTKDMLTASDMIPNDEVEGIYKSVGKILFTDESENMTKDEAMQEFYNKAPEKYKKYTSTIFQCIANGLKIYSYTYELLDKLKGMGYRIYYLSNWERWTYEIEEDIFKPLLDKFDGGLFSFSEGCKKPDAEFYIRLLDKYSLQAERCAFFDDKAENLAGAESVGIKAVPFNYENTYKMLVSDISVTTEAADVAYDKNTILINKDNELTTVDIKNIPHWHVCESRYPGEMNEDCYYKSLIEAIENCGIMDNIEDSKQAYVFICNGLRQDCDDCFHPVCVGIINVDSNKQYEWVIQYPVTVEGGVYKNVVSASEWAMASMNPIKPIAKPFILKISPQDETIRTKQYLFSPDVIADKYLAISEDGKLSVLNHKDVENLYIEAEYRFVGDSRRINKIREALKSGKIVDNTFFYTALTGKPLLTEDQIDFDSNFVKIDFSRMRNNILSNLATNESKFNTLIDSNTNGVLITEGYKYGSLNDKYGLRIMYSLEGYYVESSVLGYKSPYFNSVDEITIEVVETMLNKKLEVM
jgi:putative hydrolase of the HAD superfamily